MPDPVAPPPAAPVVTLKPSLTAPKAAPVAPTPAPEAPEVAAARTALAKAEKLQADINKKTKEQIAERRRWDGEKKTFGEKLKAADEFAKLKSQAKLNPTAFLKSVYGDNYYDTLVESKINGNAPTADTVALELERMEERIEAKYAAREAERAKQADESQTRAVAQARRQLSAEAAEFWKANDKDYPVFHKLGDESAVANMLSQRIEAEYNRTTQRDEAGEVLRDGRVMTMKEAADALEADILAIVDEAASHEKYQPKLRERLQPQKPSGSLVRPQPQTQPSQQQPQSSQQTRRTLSNDLTGSTPGRSPPVSDADRLARSIAAYNAAHQR